MPPIVHSPAEVHAYVEGWDLTARDVWVAEASDRLVGFTTLTATWLDSLYVHPAGQGHGIGSALLELAMSLRPDGFGLWVFETNTPARALYRRYGFVEVERAAAARSDRP